MPNRTPVTIEKRGDTEVRIVWDDGHESTWANSELRLACGCAHCVDEWTGERRLQRHDVQSDVKPTGIELVGNYALHFAWSDGHASGIYSYDLLRSICPCADCRSAAPSERGQA
jgi:DUF971 family protein